MHIKFNYSLSAGFRFTIIILMLFLNDYLFTQVRIKEKVVINTQNQPNILKSKNQSELSTGITTITAILNYRACSGYAVLYIDNSPCNSYNNSATGPNVNGYGDSSGIVKLTVNAYDYGVYSFGITSYLSCPPYTSTCGFSTNCKHSVTIKDNNGFSNTIPGDGPNPQGVTYFNNTSNICTDVQPQTLTENNIERYTENSSFSWIDENGNIQTIIGIDGCSYDPPPPGMIDFGKTFIMHRVSPVLNAQPPYYKPLSDRIIRPCLNTSTKKWVFRIYNVRIPIFESICKNKLDTEGYVDLKDGKDYSILSQHIRNCGDWYLVRDWLRYFSRGTHNTANKPPGAGRFYFSPGILKHEEQHRLDLIDIARKWFDIYFDEIFKIDAPKNMYPCAKSAADAKQNYIDLLLSEGAYVNARRDTTMLKQWSKADDAARPVYEEIRANIKFWVDNVARLGCKF